jgi:ribosome-associated heat shock protein Hsp15
MENIEKMRVDKWLWCVRIFKSRSIASDACKSNHVSMNGAALKPSHLIKPGDHLRVKKEGFFMEYEVLTLLKSRVGAPIAITCYINHTPEAELKKFDAWYTGQPRIEFREKGAGRPTKKERRVLDDFKKKK